jgi:putative aminopeptidase FrvX
VTGFESSFLSAFAGEGTEAAVLAVPVKFAGTPSEVVDGKDVQALADIVIEVVKSGRLK